MTETSENEGDLIVGIDLGTTNSEIAAYVKDRVSVLGEKERMILPSCVGLSPSGELLVGQAARHQQLLYPERTIRSIKRKMGSTEKVTLGDQSFLPEEISAFILKELVVQAERTLGRPVTRAVITVPAYFSDAQRQATRQAGLLAGLTVVRILNEPTAASLAYGGAGEAGRTVLVYDLGGGTFDVSLVTSESGVTEVLASHGNNRLGGDDFDDLLTRRLLATFKARHGLDLVDASFAVARTRLAWAAEEARKQLSFHPAATIREESLVVTDGVPVNFETEITRHELEELIRPLVDTTLESVWKTLTDARKRPEDIDKVLLVGGTTRTPLISRMLEEVFGQPPSQEVHPDLCVALGAGVLASRLSGQSVDRVLVDVSPYSFGPSHLGLLAGEPYIHCYHPIIRRNTPLPVTRTDSYSTAAPFQDKVLVEIYQGDDPDALRNTLVGDFWVEGLTPMEEPNEVLCRMSLDIDGILQVTAIEKITGKSKHISIAHALREKSKEELAEARKRMEALYSQRDQAVASFSDAGEWEADGEEEADGEDEERDIDGDDDEERETDGNEERSLEEDGAGAEGEANRSAGSGPVATGAPPPDEDPMIREGRTLLERSRRALPGMHPEDQEEAVDLNERLARAVAEPGHGGLPEAITALKELLFFVEGSR